MSHNLGMKIQEASAIPRNYGPMATCRGEGSSLSCDSGHWTRRHRGLRPGASRGLVVLAACIAVTGAACSSGTTRVKAKQTAVHVTSTSKPETQPQRARRLLAEQCRSRYAVPIEVRPSRVMPSTSSGDTTVYFFEIYARDTGAFLADGTWTIRGDQETYGCG